MPIALSIVYTVRPGSEADAERFARALQAGARTEPGCIFFIAHRSPVDPRRFHFYEMYADEAALEAHRNTPHFKQFALEGIRTIAETRDAETFVPLT